MQELSSVFEAIIEVKCVHLCLLFPYVKYMAFFGHSLCKFCVSIFTASDLGPDDFDFQLGKPCAHLCLRYCIIRFDYSVL
jgi:hypothetical protein